MSERGPYGRAVLEHFRRPRNYGSLPGATVEAEGSNPLCGDHVRIALALDASGSRIEEARFTANACAVCIASASLLTDYLRGMERTAATTLSDDDVVALLGNELPAARRRCAVLPLEAVRRALETARPRPDSRRMVVAVLLAAGNARRFGSEQKLLAQLPNGSGGDVPVVRESARALQRGGIDRVVVVLGRDGEQVRATLSGLNLEFAVNLDYQSGMSTSLRSGVRGALDRWPEAAGILIALGDQPLLDDRIVKRLIIAFTSSTRALVVAPRYRGDRGNPVVFSRELADELLEITGDQGARAIIERDPGRVTYVDFDSVPPVDIDTRQDLARLAAALQTRSYGRSEQ
jgi:molybdenum cofactor cytidylyltransferase